MNRKIMICLAALLAVAGTLYAHQPEYRPGVVLVRFANVNGQPPNTAAKNMLINSALGGSGSPVKREYTVVQGLAKVILPAGMAVESAVASLKQSPSILYAEPDYKLELCVVPNDPMFGQLWGMHTIGAPDAWDISTGSSSVIVAVTDSGVDYIHQDLAGNMWHNPGEIPNNGIDDDGDGYIDDVYGVDTGDNDGNPMDDSVPISEGGAGTHGTHVAGTIGAVGNNARGVTGVCWDVSIMAVKFADSNGILWTDAAIRGIEYARSKNAKVMNASWGGFDFSQALYDAVAAARSAGILFVAAAGNYNVNNDQNPFYPASFDLDNVISVMATTETDQRADFSHYGLTSVDIGAPGVNIRSTLPGNQYANWDGTSMASPHVAGACALLLSIDPTLTYSQVKQILINTVDPTLEGLCVSGGRMNLAAAADEVATDSTAPTPNPAQWDIMPKATGLHTVTMRAVKATDRSAVEYYFECVNDVNINSGWRSATLYSFTTLSPGTTYGFRLKARDASNNQTEWSTTVFTKTAISIDNLSPAPDPARFEILPKPIAGNRIGMMAGGFDETGPLQYKFRTPTGDTSWQPDANFLYTPTNPDPYYVYYFQCKVRDAVGNETDWSSPPAGTRKVAGSRVIHVSPDSPDYPTIQSGINAAAGPNDIVEVSPGTYNEFNITFLGKAITVRSTDPTNPDIVAATIVDCMSFGRGFIFNNFEGANSVLDGLTISNGRHLGPDSGSGLKGGNAYGGGILCGDPNIVSPTIKNCVIRNCRALGGRGGNGNNGADGSPGQGGDNPTPPGNGGNGVDGGDGGSAYGGGIYVGPGSSPTIQNCEIISCFVRPGSGGNGGNGGAGGTGGDFPQARGGRGGAGGDVCDVSGGGLYTAAGSSPIVIGGAIQDCNAIVEGAIPGLGGAGGAGNPPGQAGANGIIGGLASGGGAFYNMSTTATDVNISATVFTDNEAGNRGGGAYFMPGSQITTTLSGCQFIGNFAGNYGGGVYYSSNAVTSYLKLTNCTFSSNGADNVGGGLKAGDLGNPLGAVVTINGSSFTGNDASEGAGMYLSAVDLKMRGSALSDNISHKGGAITGFSCKLDINDSNIIGNAATQPGGYGGGFALWNSTGNVKSCTFRDNTADDYGGAVSVEGGATLSPVQFINCLITDNSASTRGGGVSASIGGWAKLVNCTLVNNSATDVFEGAGGGVSSSEYMALVELENSILWNNSATYGPQIAVGKVSGSSMDIYQGGPFADVIVGYSDVKGGRDDVFLELDPSYTALWWLAGNIDANPLFANPVRNESSYYLSQIKAGQLSNSPCVDAGSGPASALESLVGEPLTTRTDLVSDAGTVDMGYHYKAGPARQYNLTIEVFQFDPNESGHGRLRAQSQPGSDSQFNIIDPNNLRVAQGTVVNLTAIPDPCYKVQYWSDTDNDGSTALTNTVMMNSNKKVVVAFAPDGFYYLTVTVIGNGTVDPNGRTLRKPNDVVTLTATPNKPNDKIEWTGTDNDYSQARTNTVTMTGHKNVTVEFYTPRILYVGGDSNYPTIQAAIDNAQDRDIIQLMPSPQPYFTQWGYVINGKDITITSVNPFDPAVVASTVIQQANGENGNVTPAFRFSDVSPKARLQGITIRGFGGGGGPGANGNPQQNGHYDGEAGGTIRAMGIRCYEASPTIENCVIDNCFIVGGPGGKGAGGDEDHPNGGNGGWPGGARGSALYCDSGSSPRLINCTFSNNTSIGGDGGNGGDGSTQPPGDGGRGGGWHYGDNAPLPSPWEVPWAYDGFSKPKDYSGLGGAVYLDTGSSPTFIDCNFINNRCAGGLNGLCGADSVGGIEEPSIRYKIDTLGGAVYLKGGASALFDGCTFTDNIADTNKLPASNDGFVSFGGAVACEDGATPIFVNSRIVGNNADVGGGIYSVRSDTQIDGTDFLENIAIHGAGVLITDGLCSITASYFTGNNANSPGSEGGAVALLGSNAEVVDSNIFMNRSAGSGGGIYVSSKSIDGKELPGGNTVLIKNCLVTENTADLDGGGIAAAWYSDPNIVNCTIVNNRAGGLGAGIFSSLGSFVNIVNTIIWDNFVGIGSTGTQIAVSYGPAGLLVQNSDVQGATDANKFNVSMDTLDLVFCIDTTGSMFDDINAVKAAAGEITDAISSQFADFRLALVDYKDFYDDINTAATYGSPGDYPYRDVVRFTANPAEIIAGLQPMTADGGADWPESVYTALMHCIDANKLVARLIENGEQRFIDVNSPGIGTWRQGRDVLRVILLMADAPPHDPEPYTDYTLNDIAAAAGGDNPVYVIPVVIGEEQEAVNFLTAIATSTGGTIVQAADANEVVDAVLEAVDLMTQIPNPVFVDVNCFINWNPDTLLWDLGSGNIDADPCFIAGYFLSQIPAGQTFTSPCVDAGSADANSPGIELDGHTTRTDSVPDQNIVDMGYHYPLFTPIQYLLHFEAIRVPELPEPNQPVIIEPNTNEPIGRLYNWFTTVHLKVNRPPDKYQVLWTGADDDTIIGPNNTVTMIADKTVSVTFVKNTSILTVEVIGGHGTVSVSPEGPTYPRNAEVNLMAHPDAGYRVKAWTGTDDDSSFELNNTVTMAGDKHVTVEFEVPFIRTVPGDFTTIQGAVNAARSGDIVSVASGLYNTPGLEIDKEITITSTNPDDPCVVSMTVIDGNGIASIGVIFGPGATGQTVLNGITIANCGYGRPDRDNATVAGEPGPDGYNSSGGGIYITSGAAPTIKNCIIRNCNISGGNAGAGGNANATTNAGHGGWGGWARGAGIFVAQYASPTFINCTVENCTATGGNGGNGGNYAQDGGDAGYGGNWSDGILWQTWGYIGDYRFYSGYGAGVYCDVNSSASFIACSIINNTASGGLSGIGGNRGAGIQIPMPDTAYRLPGYGGGVYCGDNSRVEFIDCNIKGNLAPKPDETYHTDPYLGHGGGIAFEKTASARFVNCNISDNIASVGGGMFWADDEPELQDCNISANMAYVGGGIYGTKGSSLIMGCHIYNNRAGALTNDVDAIVGQGGGIFSSSMNAFILDCNFFDNFAGASGGGIYFHGPVEVGDNNATVQNCLMINNGAGRDGGAISVNWNVSAFVANCTLHNNYATGAFGDPTHTGLGGGLYCSYGAVTDVIDSIIWRNEGLVGNEIAVDTGFELDPHCGTVNVSYSDVRGGAAGAHVGKTCTLNYTNPGHNISVNPLFVSEMLGDYRLQQIGAGYVSTSACVNAGSDEASTLGLGQYTTRTDGVPDRSTVDMGYHYRTPEPCRFADIRKNGFIDFGDFAKLAGSWLDSGCADSNWCDMADLTFNGVVDIDDLVIITDCWLAWDAVAPDPNPAQWAIEPQGQWPSSVRMRAAVAVDELWGLTPVEYYFECTTGNCNNSGWQQSVDYIDTGLQPYTEYAYRVKARDARHNETEWSVMLFTVIEPDHQPPTPDPMTWEITPYASSGTSISMRATVATDPVGGVQYEFEFNDVNAGTVTTSGWRSDPNYTKTGLDPNGPYCFRVRARDLFDNNTAWSEQICVANLGDVTPPAPAPFIVPMPASFYVTGQPITADSNSGPFQFLTAPIDYRWWHRVVANVSGITDDSGDPNIAIRFICIDNDTFSSDKRVPEPNRPILIGPQDPIGSREQKFIITFIGRDRVVYDVDVDKPGGLPPWLTWQVCVYDPTQNEACSPSYQIRSP